MTDQPVNVVLADLTRRGIQVVADGDRLRYRPQSAMTPELAARVRRHKPELLALLGDAGFAPTIAPEDLPPDWRIEWEERAAIREYDGGQAREHAEAEAFSEILTRMRAAGQKV